MSNEKTYTVWYKEGKFFEKIPAKAFVCQAESPGKAQAKFFRLVDPEGKFHLMNVDLGDTSQVVSE